MSAHTHHGLGTLHSTSKEVTIIGGGFSGLVTGCILSRRGYRITLHEASSRVGGLIQTEQTPWGISEWAAHSVLATQSVESFMDSLNFQFMDVHPRAKKKYIYRRKRIRQNPLTFAETAETLLRAALAKSPTDQRQGVQSLSEWGARHLGVPATQALLVPMINGVFAASPSEIALEAAFPSWTVPPGRSLLGTLWRSRKDRKRDAGTIMTPLNGMGEWISAMEAELKRDQTVLLGSKWSASQLAAENKGKSNLIIATEAPQAADLLDQVDPHLAKGLRSVRYTPLMTATVFLKLPKSFPSGQGILFAPGEHIPCLGILLNSKSFENRTLEPEYSSLTFFFGGSQEPEALNLRDEQVCDRILEVFRKAFHFEASLLGVSIHRHPRAIPVYDESLPKLWQTAATGWCSQPGRLLLGNYTGQVSLRGMVQRSLAL